VKSKLYGLLVSAPLVAMATGAQAQRASDNVVAAAEDAFGTRIGNDSVGLYDARSARGFDPQLAGNVRIDGLYFDQQAQGSARITRAQTMRVGLSAQSYPFPAPTGIVDLSLIMPAPETVITAAAQWVTIGSRSLSLDISTPIFGEKLGVSGGVNVFSQASEWNGRNTVYTAAAVFRAKPSDNIELIPFIYWNHNYHVEAQPLILPGTTTLPRPADRGVFYGQDWATNDSSNFNAGVVGRAAVGGWRLQAALFRSIQDRPRTFTIFYRNTQPDGSANLDIIGFPAHKSASTSGEVRASGVFTQSTYRHTVHLAVRARDTDRLFGGGQTQNFGHAVTGVYQEVPQRTYTFGVRDKDAVRQISPGITYVGQWANVGEFSVGLQKSFYRRNFGKLAAVSAQTRAQPWLYNGTVAIYAARSLTLYGGFTRGLEEFGAAPDNAANAGEPLPAKQTRQVDAGLRWTLQPGLNLIAGVFEVEKPYFDRNTTTNIYTDVGKLRHRGVEMSLSGRPAPGLTMIIGALALQARASGAPVDQGLIGDRSPGTPPFTFKSSIQYDIPAVPGLSADVNFEVFKSYYANRANTLKVPTQTPLALGMRYDFRGVGETSSLRLQVQNIFNEYGWNADGSSGRLAPMLARRYTLRLATDF